MNNSISFIDQFYRACYFACYVKAEFISVVQFGLICFTQRLLRLAISCGAQWKKALIWSRSREEEVKVFYGIFILSLSTDYFISPSERPFVLNSV